MASNTACDDLSRRRSGIRGSLPILTRPRRAASAFASSPAYMEEQSSPEDSHFVWSYAVEISQRRQRDRPAQIAHVAHHRRTWPNRRGARAGRRRPDADHPPGKSFNYTSGCPLQDAPWYHGRQLPDDGRGGKLFDVAIPAFSLDSPYTATQHELNRRPPMSAARGPIYTPVELLARLVAFDTTSHKINLGLDSLRRRLSSAARRRRAGSFSDDGQKSLALRHASAQQGEGGVALSGHTDVVPVDGQTWTSDPFTLPSRRRPPLWARLRRHEGLSRSCSRRRS